jgi:secreted trypsin-like serine protease
VADEKFIALGKEYTQICHLSDGEATLIKEDWVVTAAHVATALQRELENGKTPVVSIADNSYDVKKVVLHPNFVLSKTFIEHDIALIQIKGAIRDIPFAKLYDKQDEKGKKITIVGRGDIGTGLTGPQKWDKITRGATNRIDDTFGQWIVFKFDSPNSENTTELEGVSGPGDSGGPAFIDINNVRYIVGVSSNQRGNGKEGVYGVREYYSRISFYKNWIEKNLQ